MVNMSGSKAHLYEYINQYLLRPLRLASGSPKYKAVYKALVINGWTSENKLAMLYDLVQQSAVIPGDILEIGSAWGRSTILLGLASQIDIWSIDPHTGGLAYVEAQQVQDSFEEFKSNLAKNNMTERVHILKHATEEVLIHKLISEQKRFSLAFIDGMHTPECVELDFQLTYPRLNPGGFIVFDDYYQPSVVEYARRIDQIAARNSLTLTIQRKTGLVWMQKPAL